jgi:UDP-glucuronate decarboxylase
MLELAETVLRLSGSSSKLTFWPRPPDDPQHRQPDISMASRELVWEPRVTLEDGLKETINYFRLLLNPDQRS